jgi:hypothetical protein
MWSFCPGFPWLVGTAGNYMGLAGQELAWSSSLPVTWAQQAFKRVRQQAAKFVLGQSGATRTLAQLQATKHKLTAAHSNPQPLRRRRAQHH